MRDKWNGTTVSTVTQSVVSNPQGDIYDPKGRMWMEVAEELEAQLAEIAELPEKWLEDSKFSIQSYGIAQETCADELTALIGDKSNG